ncbi:hypothetical protein SCFA_540001 [anaerobic digester metagenome]|uniref:Uncharacterized protein n=1 Tax=anaerobic digester metagenome TaxID=1263854 RepID=A0A485M2Q7_9ZZZZ
MTSCDSWQRGYNLRLRTCYRIGNRFTRYFFNTAIEIIEFSVLREHFEGCNCFPYSLRPIRRMTSKKCLKFLRRPVLSVWICPKKFSICRLDSFSKSFSTI